MTQRGEPGDAGTESARFWLDPTLAVLVFATTASYLAALPFHLGHADEAHYLHEAKRLLAGDRLYRDIFEIATPGWMYLMALLFRVFGVTLATARVTAAVIHAGTAALLYLVCRRLAVRRGLGLACAATYVAICPFLYPVASQHWLVTFLGVVLLLLCLRPLGTRTSFWLGFVVGLAIAVHQGRGLALGGGVAGFLVLDALVLRRTREPPGRVLAVAFGAGLLTVVVPMMAGLVASAGLVPVWDALVVTPLQSYRGTFSAAWGKPGGPVFTLRGLMQYLPLALLCSVPRLAGLWRGRSDWDRVRAATVLIVLGLSSIMSIRYYPDYIHIAFIAPLFLVALADGVERVLRPLPGRVQTSVAYVATLAILSAVGLRLYSHSAAQSSRPTTTYHSAFGPVEIPASSIVLWDKLADLLSAVPSRTLYCHPTPAYAYLLVDARNPTRFEFIDAPAYHTPAQVDEVIHVLRTTDVPYILMNPQWLMNRLRRDPISVFIRENYELVADEALARWGVWQRRSSGAAGGS